MKTVTLEKLNEQAMNLLCDLAQLKLLRFDKESQKASEHAEKIGILEIQSLRGHDLK